MPQVWCTSHDSVILKNPKLFAVIKLPRLQEHSGTLFLLHVLTKDIFGLDFLSSLSRDFALSCVEKSHRSLQKWKGGKQKTQISIYF